MGKNAYIGVNGIARKIKAIYVGVNGVAQKGKKAYIGVSAFAKEWWTSGGITPLNLLYIVSNKNKSGESVQSVWYSTNNGTAFTSTPLVDGVVPYGYCAKIGKWIGLKNRAVYCSDTLVSPVWTAYGYTFTNSSTVFTICDKYLFGCYGSGSSYTLVAFDLERGIAGTGVSRNHLVRVECCDGNGHFHYIYNGSYGYTFTVDDATANIGTFTAENICTSGSTSDRQTLSYWTGSKFVDAFINTGYTYLYVYFGGSQQYKGYIGNSLTTRSWSFVVDATYLYVFAEYTDSDYSGQDRYRYALGRLPVANPTSASKTSGRVPSRVSSTQYAFNFYNWMSNGVYVYGRSGGASSGYNGIYRANKFGSTWTLILNANDYGTIQYLPNSTNNGVGLHYTDDLMHNNTYQPKT